MTDDKPSAEAMKIARGVYGHSASLFPQVIGLAIAIEAYKDAAVRRAVEEEREENARLRASLEKILMSVEAYSDPTRIEEWHGEIARAALSSKEAADDSAKG